MTSEAAKAFQVCAGTSQSSQQQCTVKGTPGQCDVTNPSACATGQKCCDLGSGFFICLPNEACP
jgi:hypothetical protein